VSRKDGPSSPRPRAGRAVSRVSVIAAARMASWGLLRGTHRGTHAPDIPGTYVTRDPRNQPFPWKSARLRGAYGIRTRATAVRGWRPRTHLQGFSLGRSAPWPKTVPIGPESRRAGVRIAPVQGTDVPDFDELVDLLRVRLKMHARIGVEVASVPGV
jgi:hypothetical protein